MPSNNAKNTPEFREKTAQYVVENRKSATSIAEEIGIDKYATGQEHTEEKKPAQLLGRKRDP